MFFWSILDKNLEHKNHIEIVYKMAVLMENFFITSVIINNSPIIEALYNYTILQNDSLYYQINICLCLINCIFILIYFFVKSNYYDLPLFNNNNILSQKETNIDLLEYFYFLVIKIILP